MTKDEEKLADLLSAAQTSLSFSYAEVCEVARLAARIENHECLVLVIKGDHSALSLSSLMGSLAAKIGARHK